MIFAITGTHEQPFDRLVTALDAYAQRNGDEPVVIQRGYSTHVPRFARSEVMYDQDAMGALAAEARVIVTHAGPGSIWLAFQHDKIPVVVPRMKRYGEHVDDHQVTFARHLSSAGRAPAVEEIGTLAEVLDAYDEVIAGFTPPGDASRANRARLARALEEMLSPPPGPGGGPPSR